MRLGSFWSGMHSGNPGLRRQRTASLAGEAIGGAIGGFIAGPAGAQVGAQIGNAAGNYAGTRSPSNWKVTVSPPHTGAAYGVGVDDVPYGATVIQMTRGSGWGTSRPYQQPGPVSGSNLNQINRNLSNWGKNNPTLQNPNPGQNPGQSPTPNPQQPGPVSGSNLNQINRNLSNWGKNNPGQNPNATPLIDRAMDNGGDPPTSLIDGTGKGGDAPPLFEDTEKVGDPSSYYTPPSGGMGSKATMLSSQFQ